MEKDIVAQGVELMLYGMGTVVVFLALLVLVTLAMSTLINRFFPEPQLPVPTIGGRRTATAPDQGELIAAITAAVHQHRSKKDQA